MAQAFLIQKSGGGGVNQTLPEQVTAFHAAANPTPQITLTWTNPVEHFAGVVIVKKVGSAPEKVNDGVKVYNGTDTNFVDTDVLLDVTYFYRAFAYNEKKQYQTLYAVASAKPVEGIPLSSMAEGALVNIMEDGTAVPFYLAKHDYESGLNGAGRQLFVRKELCDKRQWDSESSVGAYATSSIDSWLNNVYKALFSDAIKTAMGETTFYYTVSSTDKTVTTLSRAIFLLSVTEFGKTNYANVEGSALPIAETIAPFSQWTRSPNIISKNNVCVMGTTGNVGYVNPKNSTGYNFRTAFTLPATALVNPSPNADGSYTLIEEVA